jgi:hypothetical protein
MKRVTYIVALALVALPVRGALAQTGIRPPQGWSFGLLGGAVAFSDMHRSSVTVSRPTPTGVQAMDFARRVGAETATVMSGYLAYWPSRNWGLRLQAGYAPSRFEALMNESEAERAGVATESDDQKLAGLTIITADIQALFRLPTIKNRVLPYGIIGGGLARYAVQRTGDPVPAEATGDFDRGARIRPAAIIGAGAMLPFQNRAFRLHFELTNHIAGTPLKGGESQTIQVGDSSLEFNPRQEPAGEPQVSLINGVRFMVGVSWSPNR